jgi:glycosyltransferase involved in cell wall biosynthesis
MRGIMLDLSKYILEDYELVNQASFDYEQVTDTKISFNIMVRDEERCIARCLDSIINLADEIIIADTGSKDKTLDIISGYESDKIKLFNLEWSNDFSKIRNFMLEKSSFCTIFQIDADEYIDQSVEYDEVKKVIAVLLNTFKYEIVIAPIMRDATECVYPKL